MFVTYPDTSPPFATVALNARAGSPGYADRLCRTAAARALVSGGLPASG
ncbi:hypothetical protein HMPREF1980_00853 [Actinomyces sp. oral taxon 172 str. F0311]|nr:hypothetical protein HMPREF1980_00853 [Actinomyces sp. oral taxon 172 str. F0311]